MNKNSNAYIITYSTVMVVVVALVLAFAALSLQPRQKANADNEKKGAILTSIGQGGDADKAADKMAYIEEQYDKYIVESFAVNPAGGKVEGANAFGLLDQLKKEYAKPQAERTLPVFISRDDDGTQRAIFPLYGSGLWGPIWGYLALEGDWNTIYGISLDHQGETPGLGAEIATPPYESQFKGKTIFSGEKLVGISVTKGAGSSAGNPNAVDAISGGTITSRGVEDMIRNNLADYAAFIGTQKAGGSAQPAADTETLTEQEDEQ